MQELGTTIVSASVIETATGITENEIDDMTTTTSGSLCTGTLVTGTLETSAIRETLIATEKGTTGAHEIEMYGTHGIYEIRVM
tara:strand:+ start:15658 stop:15906 length:249 start_codon:yes stop_codon:yes gene_type:complete